MNITIQLLWQFGRNMKNSTLEINLTNIKKNLDNLKQGKEVCIMVKANCYGLGFDMINEYVKLGYNFFGVSTIDEAIEVRKRSATAKILLASYLDQEDYDLAIEHNITATVYSMEMLTTIPAKLAIHLKFDIGMGRLGISYADTSKVKEIIKERKLEIEGLMGHFPMAGNVELTMQQISRFKELYHELSYLNLRYVSLQNSLGTIKYDIDFCNLVRPGIGVLGYYANIEEKAGESFELYPSLTLKAPVTMEKNYQGTLGYDLVQEVDGNIITVRIGYHDGLSRKFSQYKFTNAQIVGKISMCQVMMQTTTTGLKEVEVFGPHEDIYQLASYGQMTIYELLVSIAPRIKKIYVEN